MADHEGVCHWCRHAGADQVDHIRNVASFDNPADAEVLSNLAPIHGAPCEVCLEACHLRTTAQEAAAARAKVTALTRYQSGLHPSQR